MPDDLLEYFIERFWEPETYSEKEVDEAFWNSWLDEIDQMAMQS